MKNKIKLLALISALSLSLVGCDISNQLIARNFGGSYDLNLPKGEKLVEVNWKESDLWYLTLPMEDNYEPQVYKFQADSTFGVFEGVVTVIESK